MKPDGTLLLTRGDVAGLLDLDQCIEAVEQAFKMHLEGKTLPPGVLGVPSRTGGFHIKAAGLKLARTYFAVKTNGNFFENKAKFGMPNIQGIIMLCDGENGYPLALMDSIEITIVRTGAATAVAAKYLARPDSRVATIVGCGNQGRIQLKALMKVLDLERVYAYDSEREAARRFAEELSSDTGVEVKAVGDLSEAVLQSDVCVTCTPSKRAILGREHVAPGAFIAAVGADNEDKRELDADLMASGKIVVDIMEQCATIGELHHALEEGVISRSDVHSELAEVIGGRKAGRTDREEIIIFDSTGTALQDVAAAAAVYEKALKHGAGISVNFAG
jgi:alanine dehydrogenase